MADLDKLSIQIESDAGKATSQLDALSAAMGKLKAALDKLPVTQNNAIKQLGETLGHVSNAAEHSGLKKTSQEMDRVSRSVRKAGSAFKKTSSSVGQFFGSLTRIGMYRGVRLLLSSITSGAKSGFMNLAQYSDTAAASLSRLNSVSAYLSNSLGAALGPVVAGLIPILNSLSSAIATALNWLNALFAALGGGITFTAAKEGADGLSSSLGGAGGAAKKLKQELMGFDEINSLKPDSGGGGGGGGSLNYDDMFEELPITEEIKEFAEVIEFILPTVQAVASVLASWALANAFITGLNNVHSVLGKIAAGLSSIVLLALDVHLSYKFTNDYINTGEIKNMFASAATGVFSAFVLASTFRSMGVPGRYGASIALVVSAFTQLKAMYDGISNGGIKADSVQADVIRILSSLTMGAGTALMFGYKAGGVALTLTLGLTAFINNIKGMKADGGVTLSGILESKQTLLSFVGLTAAGALAGFSIGGLPGAGIGAAVGAGLTLIGYIGALVFEKAANFKADTSAFLEYFNGYMTQIDDVDIAAIDVAVALNLKAEDIVLDPTVFAQAQVLVDNLFALQGEDGTLDITDNRVKAYIDELNMLNINGLNEQLAITDGHLVGTKTSLKAIIELERQRAKQQAYIDILGKAYKTLAEKTVEVHYAELGAAESQETLNGLLEQANAILAKNGLALLTADYYTGEYTGDIMELSESVRFLSKNEEGLFDSLIDTGNEVVDNREKAEQLKSEYSQLAEQTEKLEVALENAANALPGETTSAAARWAEGIKGQVIGVIGAVKSTVDELASHISGLNPVLKIKAKVSAPEITYYSNGNASVQITPSMEYTKFAGGGIADAGSLILAGEAGPEIVGQVGNKTGVVNDTQIADIISSQMARNGGGASAGDIANAVVNAMTGLGVYIGREQVGRVVAQAIDDNRSADGKFAYNLA